MRVDFSEKLGQPWGGRRGHAPSAAGGGEAGAAESERGRHFRAHCLHAVFEWPSRGFRRKLLVLECQLVN